ncbi:MAG: terminase [Methylibium sp.]|nr:terminase [Methylibium sp.]
MDLELHPKQTVAFETQATEILYGGAAGGGKSHLMRVCAVAWCIAVPGLQVYLFRRTHPDLWKNHMEGPSSFPSLLADWMASGFVRVNLSDGQVIFGNGSKIHLCHCQHAKDVLRYQGAEIHVLMIDELTHFPESVYRFLRGRCRLGAMKLPEKWAGYFPRILNGANPGGEGHHWVKASFIDNAVPLSIRPMEPKDGGMQRQYIPARLDDNPTMDADYGDKLSGLGNESLVRAMLEGDWDIVAGAYFTEFMRDRHVVKPFTIPSHWTRYRCFDWGSAKPFACYWIAVSDGEMPQYPRGALIYYREYYGMREVVNTGLKLPADKVAQEIKRRDRGDTTGPGGWGVADPSIFTVDGGESIAETMRKQGVTWRRADNKRIPGWEQMRIRLDGDGDNKPMIFFFETCVHLIRTLPALQHDEHKPEDVDTNNEDHAPDAARYGCMARPIVRGAPKARPSDPSPGSIEWLLKRTAQEKERSQYRG